MTTTRGETHVEVAQAAEAAGEMAQEEEEAEAGE